MLACGASEDGDSQEVAYESVDLSATDTGADAHDARVDAHDTGADAHDAGLDAHDAGADAHDAAVDAHDAAGDAHDAGADAHDGGIDAHDAGADAHDAGADAHDAGADAHDAGNDASCGNCDDDNPCTTDSCVSGTCTHTAVANGTSCNDGNACTTGDMCTAGVCGGTAVSCTASDSCHLAGTCNPSTGICSNPTASDGTACNDGNACTTSDVCTAGVCGGTAVTCPATDACHTAGTCNPANGSCSSPAAPSGTACGSSNQCLGALLCDGNGNCVQQSPAVISTSNPCVLGSCSPDAGVVYTPIPGCGPTTNQWQPIVGRPSPRDGAAGVYLPVQNALLVFGGANAGAPMADTWTWNRVTNLWSGSYPAGPTGRAAAAVAYDSVRQRVVLFGGLAHGAAGDTFLGDTWEYDPVAQAWQSASPAAPPPARAYAAIGFDSARGKTVLFGGRGASGAADAGYLWEWDGATWTQRQAMNPPLGRATAAMVYDSVRARFVLFGGETAVATTAGAALGDTQELDPVAAVWTTVATPTAPPARMGHAMYFDAARSKTVLFGGTSLAQPALGDIWEYDGAGATWTAPTPSRSPPARAGHFLAFDSTTGHGLLVGGVSYSSTAVHTPNLDDVWEYDPIASTWSLRSVDAAPALYRPGLTFDASRSAFVLRGDEVRPAMWELANGRWTVKEMLAGQDANFGATFVPIGASGQELAPTGTVYDPIRRRTMLVVQGAPATLGLDSPAGPQPATPPQIWEWDGATWTLRACSGGPLALSQAGIAYDTNRGVLVVVGGTQTGFLSTGFLTWEVDSATCTWTERTPPASPPVRNNPNVVWDSTRNLVVLFSGSNNQPDTWEWDGVAGKWTPRATAVSPPARSQAGIAFDPMRGRVVLFGGQAVSDVVAPLGDLWEYDGTAGAWTNPVPAVGPGARTSPGLAFDPTSGRVLFHGGTGFLTPTGLTTLFTDLWAWDGTSFTRRLLGASPGSRSGASGGFAPARGIGALFGGERGDGERSFLQDTWIWEQGEWSSPSAAFANNSPAQIVQEQTVTDLTPPARAGHAFALGMETSPQMSGFGLLFGGQGDEGLLGDSWLWDDQFYVWTMFAGSGPPARAGHAMAAIPGTGFLLFGGSGAGGALLNDSWVFGAADVVGGWLPLDIISPSARTEHAMAFDAATQKVVLFGGRNANGALQDTWEYNTVTSGWTQRTPSFSPPARFGHAMFYDSSRGTVVMTGGTGNDPSTTLADAYEWDSNAGTWTDVPSETPIAPRAGALAFFDATLGQPVVSGGLVYGQGGAEVATYGDTTAFARGIALAIDGVACTSASMCASGFCVDGNCCNSACTGQCAACDVAGSLGTCTAVMGSPHGNRSGCSVGACFTFCDGSNMNACTATAGTVCGGGTCLNLGVSTGPQTCDTAGVCQPATTPTSCAPYACYEGSCSWECGSIGGLCAPGAFCTLLTQGGLTSNPYGACEMQAKLGSFTASPASPVTHSPLTLTATASVGTIPIFTFTYTPPGGQSVTCGTPSTLTSCTFTPTVAGSYTVSVSVVADDESTIVPDDSQSFSITVAQGTSTSPGNPPMEWGNPLAFTQGSTTLGADYLWGIPVTVGEAGTLTALGVVPDQAGSNIQMALYSDSGGAPSALVAWTAPTLIGGGAMPIPVTTPTAIAAGAYWIMAVYDTKTVVFESATPTTAYYDYQPFGSALPSPLVFPATYTLPGSLNYFAVTESP
jgi:N-acetylneuraminic acid mutarotase